MINKIMIMMISILAIGFIGIVHAQIPIENKDGSYHDLKTSEPEVTIYPVVPSGMTSVPDGYLYFYDFDMDTHNQIIKLQSIDFVINSTDMLAYDIGGSSVGVEGQYSTIPLQKLGLYADQSDVRFFYNYSNPFTFTPNPKDGLGKFTLTLFTHWKFSTNIGVSAVIHYLSDDGKKYTVNSDWNFIKNIPDFNEGVVYCTNETCPTPQDYARTNQDQNQKILDVLDVIKMQNAVLILEEAQTNKLLAFNYCLGLWENKIGRYDSPIFENFMNNCVKSELERSK